MTVRATSVSFLVALVTSLALVVVPLYSDGLTLAQRSGPGSYAIIAVPVVIAALPLLWRHTKAITVAIFLLLAFIILTGFSIGAAYLPAWIVTLLALDRQNRVRRTGR